MAYIIHFERVNGNIERILGLLVLSTLAFYRGIPLFFLFWANPLIFTLLCLDGGLVVVV